MTKAMPCPFYGMPCEYVPMAHLTAQLLEENKRLREGLLVICGPRDMDKSYVDLFHEVVLEARAALKGGSDE